MKRIKLKGVYVSQNGKYYLFKPYIKKKDRIKYPHIPVDKNGFYTQTINLGSTTDPDRVIQKAYAEELDSIFTTSDHMTLNWLFREYEQSQKFRNLQLSTQKRYRFAATKLLEFKIKLGGKPAPLGKVDCTKMTTPLIRQALDARKKQFADPENPNAGHSELNNELAVLAAMYKHGMQYFDEIAKLGTRPTDGIEKFKTGKRKHLPTNEDYEIVLGVAREISPPYIPIVMELAKYLAARGIEITELVVSDRKQQPDGKYVVSVGRRKNSKNTRIECNDQLNKAWEKALKLHKIRPIGTSPLLISKGGGKLLRSTIDTAWQRLKQELEARGLGKHYFWLHDLKKWGVSHSADKGIAGQSLQMQELYNLEDKIYKAPE